MIRRSATIPRMHHVVVGALLIHSATVHADSSVHVPLNQQGADLARQIGLSVPALEQQSEMRVDELYKLSRIDGLLQAFGDTAAFAQRGLGVDYDPDPGDVAVAVTVAG